MRNCWGFKNCGREPGGFKVEEMGICPAAIDQMSDGLNGGIKAGRISWASTGTFCGGKVQGTFAEKQVSCLACDFYKKVRSEAGLNFVLLRPDQKRPGATI